MCIRDRINRCSTTWQPPSTETRASLLVETTLDDLAAGLGLGTSEVVSLVGGGGKTTSLFSLGALLPGAVVLTTTTKMGSERTGEVPVLVNPQLGELTEQVGAKSPVLVWAGVDGRKALGVSADDCDRWFASPRIDSVVIEADGSRKRPFKAPLDHEPVVPSSTTTLVACIGASALGQVIAESCQRPERVAAIAGCSTADLLTPERAALVLTDSDGSKKGLPPGAQFVVAAHRVEQVQRNLVAQLADTVARIDAGIDVVAVAAQSG